VSKPLHLSTNSKILVKIAPLVSELRGLESRPLKKKEKNKEKTSVKYIALPASLPSGLNEATAQTRTGLRLQQRTKTLQSKLYKFEPSS